MSTAPSPDPDLALRYPVGRFEAPATFTPEFLQNSIAEIEALPARLTDSLTGLSQAQLDTPYRPCGWTIRQVVHHFADSHLHAYTRFRLALTEDNPTIKPYNETAWGELPDAKTAPVELSLALLTGLHARWVLLLSSLKEQDWKKRFTHPEFPNRNGALDRTTGLYAWHCRHHLAHIQGLRERSGW